MKIFVPIKGESQRLPNKNFREFGGVPMWRYVIDKLLNREHEVWIDTDVPESLSGIESDRLHIYERKGNLCGGQTSVNDLIAHWLSEIIKDKIDRDEPLVQMHVTSPLVCVETVELAVRSWHSTYAINDSVMSCSLLRERVWRRKNGSGGLIPVNHNPASPPDTHFVESLFTENSVFYIFTANGFFGNGRNRVGKRPHLFQIPSPENLDIDTEDDWKVAEALLKAGVAK